MRFDVNFILNLVYAPKILPSDAQYVPYIMYMVSLRLSVIVII